MRRQTFLLLLLLMTAGLFRPAPVAAQSSNAIFQAVNRFRVSNGLPPFSYNGRLATAAQQQANYMAEFGVYSSHTGYGGSRPADRAGAAGYGGRVIEIIVGGTGMDAEGGVRWWRNSPVHYAALVSGRYIEAGAGFASDGRSNYYVLVAGTPAERPPPAAAATADDPPPLIITPITLARPRADGAIIHTVREGQALWSLAAHYDVPLTRLLLYNSLTPDDFVRPGDEIIIRLADGAPPPPTPTPTTVHTVRAGQSLWSIALQYDIRFADLLWLNAINEETLLRPGDIVKVRLAPGEAPPPTPTPITHHTVQSGQTLWEVALTYNLTLEQLLAFNNLTADALIRPGDALRIRPPVAPTAPAFPPTYTPMPRPSPTITPSPLPVPGDLDEPDRANTLIAANAEVPTPRATAPVAVATPPSATSPLTIFFAAITAAIVAGIALLARRP